MQCLERLYVGTHRNSHGYSLSLPGGSGWDGTRNSGGPWKPDDFHKNYIFISPDSARYLAGRSTQTVGVDYRSVGGFGDEGAETHRILLEAGIWIIEGLLLEDVEPGDYELVCLPLKIVGGDGAPARAVLHKLVL